MQYNLKIIEYPDMTSIASSEYGCVFTQSTRLMLAIDTKVELLLDVKRQFGRGVGYSVNNHGIWLTFEDCSRFYDLKKRNFTAFKEKIIKCSSAKFSDNIIAGNRLYSENVLFCKHLDTGKVYKIEKTTHVKVDNENIFTYLAKKDVFTCYDNYLKEIWSYRLNKQLNTFVDNYYLHNDSLIINGVFKETRASPFDPFEKHDFELVSLYKKTGKIKWATFLGKAPTYSILVDDKFYLYRDDNVIIVDANNGDFLLEKPIGFLFELPDNKQQEQVSVFQHGNHIFVFSLLNKAIRIFDMEMEFIQEIELPKPNTPHCLDYFTGAPLRFVSYDDNVYCVLQHYTGLNGLAILNPTKDREPKVTIKKRPDFKLEKVPEKEGYAYKLSIDSNNLDEVVSSGEYELMEIAQYCGTDRSEHDHSDSELNGHLIYSVNKSLLPDNAEEDLKLMIERVEKFFDIYLVKSTKTGDSFCIELEFRL